jgi:hypothetical protein
VDNSDNETMEVLVTVAFPKLKTLTSEEAWEEDILNAVAAAVYADKTLDVQTIKQLGYEDCEGIFESGMPMPNYDVTLGQDGSWYSGVKPFPEAPEASGDDLQSLFNYLVEKGLVKK